MFSRIFSNLNFRAVDVQALIGNVGGYIGLCLGYSIWQLPNLLLFIYQKIRKHYAGKQNDRSQITPVPLNVTVAENNFNGMPDVRTNAFEHDVNGRLNRLEEALAKINETMNKLETILITKLN